MKNFGVLVLALVMGAAVLGYAAINRGASNETVSVSNSVMDDCCAEASAAVGQTMAVMSGDAACPVAGNMTAAAKDDCPIGMDDCCATGASTAVQTASLDSCCATGQTQTAATCPITKAEDAKVAAAE